MMFSKATWDSPQYVSAMKLMKKLCRAVNFVLPKPKYMYSPNMIMIHLLPFLG